VHGIKNEWKSTKFGIEMKKYNKFLIYHKSNTIYYDINVKNLMDYLIEKKYISS
jgi:hypothetical protein